MKPPMPSQCYYWIASPFLEDTHYLQLKPEEYEQLYSARQTLADAGAFERRLALLIENFTEMEIFYARLSLNSFVGGKVSYSYASESISEANRVLMNFLSSMQSYTDQVKSGFKKTSVGGTFKRIADVELNKVRSTSNSYAIASAIRNYAQHVEAPIVRLEPMPKGQVAWADRIFGSMESREFSDYLRREKVKLDLTEHGSWINTRKLCYDSVRLLSQYHVHLRSIIDKDISTARSSVEQALKELSAARPKSAQQKAVGKLAVIFTTESETDPLDSERITQHTLTLAWDDVRLTHATTQAPIVDYKRSP